MCVCVCVCVFVCVCMCVCVCVCVCNKVIWTNKRKKAKVVKKYFTRLKLNDKQCFS